MRAAAGHAALQLLMSEVQAGVKRPHEDDEHEGVARVPRLEAGEEVAALQVRCLLPACARMPTYCAMQPAVAETLVVPAPLSPTARPITLASAPGPALPDPHFANVLPPLPLPPLGSLPNLIPAPLTLPAAPVAFLRTRWRTA